MDVFEAFLRKLDKIQSCQLAGQTSAAVAIAQPMVGCPRPIVSQGEKCQENNCQLLHFTLTRKPQNESDDSL